VRDDITAAMIVKNEEQFLPQCLESIKDIMPVVIVDTGSTDKTMDIARDYGAYLYEHPWQDSFSEARNHVLEYIKTPWALQLDADEQLVSATVGELDNLDLKYDAYVIQLHNVMNNGAIHLHHFERLYQPSKVHYERHGHNKLVVNGEVGGKQLCLLHYGYSLSEDEMREKHERTERLLMMDIQEKGYTLENVRYLIQGYRASNQQELLLRTLDEHLEKLLPYPGVYQEAASNYIVAYNAAGNNIKAKSEGLKLLEKFPEALDALFYMGVVYWECQEWEFSIDHFLRFIQVRRSLQMEGSDASVCYHSWGNLAEAFQFVGSCESALGQKARSLLFFMRAEMLARGLKDISTYATNVDNAMCTLRDKPAPEKSSKPIKKVMNLQITEEPPRREGDFSIPIMGISGHGEVIEKE